MSSWKHFRVFFSEKSSGRQSAFQWVRIVPSFRRHLSVFIRSGFHCLCYQRERNSLNRLNLTYRYNDDIKQGYLVERLKFLFRKFFGPHGDLIQQYKKSPSHEYNYILSINNQEFEHYLGQLYPAELEIKDTTESTTFASYLDLLLSIRKDCQLHSSIYDKGDDFNFDITNFPFMGSNIPSSPAYDNFYLSTYTIRPGLLLVWMFYFEGQANFQ